jgi:hypothetical protein
MGLIEEDADWTDCGREIVGVDGWGLYVGDNEAARLCESCLGLLWQHSVTAADLELIQGLGPSVGARCRGLQRGATATLNRP